jgi:hypothetical protein
MSSVLFTSQTLTASQKNQARVNIGSTSSTPQVIATAGAINDLAVTSNHLVFTGASVVLSGIVAGLDGEEFTILNASGTNLELLSQSALSTANNRFASGVIVPNLSIVRIKYRTTTARWVLENVGINDGRYVRKDVADTKLGNLTFNTSGGLLAVRILPDAAAFQTVFQIENATSTNYFRLSREGYFSLRVGNTGSGTDFFNILDNSGNPILKIANGLIASNIPCMQVYQTMLSNGIIFNDNTNISFNTTTGTKIGTSTTQKLAFWNKTPIVQPTNAIGAGAFVANTSGIANDTATYGGYTIGQIAQALINVGILA